MVDQPRSSTRSNNVVDDITSYKYKNLSELIEASCASYGPNTAFSCMGQLLSYSEVKRQSRDFAAYLLDELKLEKGSKVALMMPNILQYPIALFGVLRAGLTVVNVNPLYTARELEHQLKDSEAQAIVVLDHFAHTLEKVVAKTQVKHIVVTRIGDSLAWPKSAVVNFAVKYVKKLVPSYKLSACVSWSKAMKVGEACEFVPFEVAGSDIAFLQYTGGTTGVSKGAMLSHYNLVANIEQASQWLKEDLKEGEESIVTALPLYHIFSLMANCFLFFQWGGHNILIPNPRDMKSFIKELKRHTFTAITGVNTLFNGLLNQEDFKQVNTSKLKLALGGGMAVQKSVADRWYKLTKVRLIQAYGLTECSPAVTMNPLSVGEFTGSIGLPLPSTKLMILGQDGRACEPTQVGELLVKGPQVMLGYWKRPEETAKTITEDGWLKTGDLAKVDEEGYVHLVDRKKDMIIVSGFNVFPNEIEDVLSAHPGVLEVAVIGVPCERSGEKIMAFVVKKDDNVTDQSIIIYSRNYLTAYKVPKLIEFRNELPKSNVGKILRKPLRDSQLSASH